MRQIGNSNWVSISCTNSVLILKAAVLWCVLSNKKKKKITVSKYPRKNHKHRQIIKNWNLKIPLLSTRASPVTQTVKNLPACRRPRFYPWIGNLEKGMATHSSILAWRIPWTEKPGRLQFMGVAKSRHDWATTTSVYKVHKWSWLESLRKVTNDKYSGTLKSKQYF